MKTQQILFLAALLTLTTAVYSQSTKEITRKGFVFAAGIGGGVHLSEGTAYGRFTVPNLKIGAMLNPKLGVMLYAPGGSSKLDGEERAFEGFIPTAQYWFTERFYVNAGVGVAIETTPFYRVDFSQGPPEFNAGLGFTVSAGHEIIQWSENKTIDVQLRLLYGSISYQDQTPKDHLAIDLVFGFNLY